MKRLNVLAGSAILGLLIVFQPAMADDDDWGYSKTRRGVAPVTNDTYAAECGACHFAYQPGLLPARSWKHIMGTLGNHFGDSAELDPAIAKPLTDYLLANAADNVRDRRSVKMARSVPADETPARITEVPYFRREHNEVPARYVTANPKVGSLSNCAACHTRAADGIYSESTVRIPGVGRWEDD